MLTILLLIFNFGTIWLGIYLFDYKLDGYVNLPLVVILSIISGTVVMLLVLAIYIEVFYQLVAKRKPQTSMLKHKIAKQMVSIPLHLLNIRIRVVGAENLPKDPGFSIYSNHTSLMDIPVLMYKLYDYPVAFLAKDVVEKMFSVGKWTPKLGCISIDRTNDRKGAESIINVIKNVKAGSTMVVFPEGTRSLEIGSLLEFKPGSFRVALKSKAPLVPMTIVKPENYRKLMWPMMKKITLVIHEPIPFEEYRHMKSQELSEKVEEIIRKPLETN